MSDNVLFDDLLLTRCGVSTLKSRSLRSGLIIKLGFPDAQFMMAVINPERRRVAVRSAAAGFHSPVLCEVLGSGNEERLYDGRIALGLELYLRHLNGEEIALGKIVRMTLCVDFPLRSELATMARSPKRWRDVGHAEEGIDEALKDELSPSHNLEAQRFLLTHPLSLNGKIAIASLLIKSHALALFDQAVRMVEERYRSVWAYQPPEIRADQLNLSKTA